MALQRFAFRAMAAANEIQVDGDDPVRAHAAAGEAIAEVMRIEAKYSRYRPDSVLSRINAGAGGAPVAVDPETESLLDYAAACWRESAGLFDATAGVLRRAWDFGARRVPGETELAPLLALIGWQRVERSPGRVRLPLPGMELDFGGLGKEYAGDLAILGPRPGGQPWRIGLRHPRREGELAATFAATSGAIATSGDYERFVEVDGVRHCHVLDPRTGRSAQGFQSVSVHAPACLVAGSATTVAMLKGESEGLAWLEALGLPFHAILADGRVVGRHPG